MLYVGAEIPEALPRRRRDRRQVRPRRHRHPAVRRHQAHRLNAVARSINVSANYLSAVFSQKMGMSFVEYVTQKRMARAKQLLRQSRKRTGEIASEVGYKDPRYF
ncbi:MAG: helix-turn-helix domain-containing protein, partial [Clostridiales bacterium]|nr:helix-turn-helix domain-containing protein [Clostridiales bacterium]